LRDGYWPEGINFVKVESLSPGGQINHGKIAYIDQRTHETVLKRSILQERDLLFSIAGTIGRVARVRANDLPANTNQALAIVRRDPDQVDDRFLYYCLCDRQRVQRASTRVVQSVQQNLSLAELSAVEIPLPPIGEQCGIATTLGVLDDKIESDRRIVDLVPRLIRAYVAEAIDDEARQIAVADLARFVNGGPYTKHASRTGRMVIRIAELNSGPGRSTVYSDIGVPNEKIAWPGDLLMSWSGSLDIYRWVLDEAIINQHIFKVLPSDGLPAWLVYDRLKAVMPVFQGIAKDKATTMGHIQRGHLESTPVQVPSRESVAELDRRIAPLWNRLLLAEQQTGLLTTLRDTLLPELLSGRIRVPEALKVVEEAIG